MSAWRCQGCSFLQIPAYCTAWRSFNHRGVVSRSANLAASMSRSVWVMLIYYLLFNTQSRSACFNLDRLSRLRPGTFLIYFPRRYGLQHRHFKPPNPIVPAVARLKSSIGYLFSHRSAPSCSLPPTATYSWPSSVMATHLGSQSMGCGRVSH